MRPGRERGDAEPIAKNVCAQLASGGHTSQANPIATSRSQDAFTKQLVHGWGRDEVRPGRERGDAEPIAKNVCAQLASGGHTSQANPIATSRSQDAFTKQLVQGWGRHEVRPGREM